MYKNVHLEDKAKTNRKNTPPTYQFYFAKSVKNNFGRGQNDRVDREIGKSETNIILF